MKNFDPKNYKILFRLKDKATCLVSEFLMNGSLGLGKPLIINREGLWTFYINRKRENIISRKGLELFGSKIKYKRYSKEFDSYINFVNKNVIPKYSKIPERMTKIQFIKLVNYIGKLWYFYGFTEYVYHDSAYRKFLETKDSSLKNNIEDLMKLKFRGRKIFNSFILKDGVIYNILRYISSKYLDKENDADYLYFKELKNLFLGVKPEKNLIRQRKLCYALNRINDQFYYFLYKESLKLSEIFIDFEKSERLKVAKEGVTGAIANRGKVQGRVVVSPVLDIEEAHRVAAKMNKGDILVVQSTNPDLMVLCNKAGAIVTDQGGMLSHAAVISRELNIPCIVGTTYATKVLKGGDLVEVDAYKGIVKKL